MKHKLDLNERILDDKVKKICHCHWIDLCNSEKGDKKECDCVLLMREMRK
jgi:hypothetical protein